MRVPSRSRWIGPAGLMGSVLAGTRGRPAGGATPASEGDRGGGAGRAGGLPGGGGVFWLSTDRRGAAGGGGGRAGGGGGGGGGPPRQKHDQPHARGDTRHDPGLHPTRQHPAGDRSAVGDWQR